MKIFLTSLIAFVAVNLQELMAANISLRLYLETNEARLQNIA